MAQAFCLTKSSIRKGWTIKRESLSVREFVVIYILLNFTTTQIYIRIFAIAISISFVYLAEQNFEEKKKREEDAANEVLKETEIKYYENLGEVQARDPRNSSLKFMYSMPIDKPKASSSR